MQTNAQNDSLAMNYRLDFAVPNYPAFNIMGTEPSNILTPSSANEFSVIAPIITNGDLTNTFAMEFAPWILFQPNINLKEYIDNGILNSLRFSIGNSEISKDSLSGNNVALGLKISLYDDGDLRRDKEYQMKIIKILGEQLLTETYLKERFREERSVTKDSIALDTILHKEMEEYVSQQLEKVPYINEKREQLKGKSYDEKLKQLKNEYKKESWNKQKIDFATAILYSSLNANKTKDLRFNSVAFWLTGACPLGTGWQFLLGANFSHTALDSNLIFKINNAFSISSRIYAGSEFFKGFLEEQVKLQTISIPTYLINLGAELNVSNGIWITLKHGWETNREYFADFDIRFQVPENMKLF